MSASAQDKTSPEETVGQYSSRQNYFEHASFWTLVGCQNFLHDSKLGAIQSSLGAADVTSNLAHHWRPLYSGVLPSVHIR